MSHFYIVQLGLAILLINGCGPTEKNDPIPSTTLRDRSSSYNLAASCQLSEVMEPGRKLTSGDRFCSKNRHVKLMLSHSGNLQLWIGDSIVWQPDICCGMKLSMQRDGNLVLRDQAMSAIWSSGTANHPGALLTIDDSGMIGIKEGENTLWSIGSPKNEQEATPGSFSVRLEAEDSESNIKLKVATIESESLV